MPTEIVPQKYKIELVYNNESKNKTFEFEAKTGNALGIFVAAMLQDNEMTDLRKIELYKDGEELDIIYDIGYY